MTTPLIIEADIHFVRRGRGNRRVMETGTAPVVNRPVGRLPRIARLMALAIRFDQLIQAGEVYDYAEIGRLGNVTRARVTQIMNLLMLAPDIQEEILFLPRVTGGRDPINLQQLQSITLTPDWRKQRKMWVEISSHNRLKDGHHRGGAGNPPRTDCESHQSDR